MKVFVNGKLKVLKEGATLKEAIKGENYIEGSLITVHLSVDTVTKTTNDFELITERGKLVLRLEDSPDAELFRNIINEIEGSTSRWVTRRLASFGSFPTDIEPSSEDRMYRKYDCFFSLGGGDNQTTYIMIAKSDHRGSYGAGSGRIGRITIGRHFLDDVREGENILEIRPVMSETSTDNVEVTTDLSFKLEDGYSVSTNVLLELDSRSPMAAEHVLTATSDGTFKITDPTGSFLANSDFVDADIKPEFSDIREFGSVTVRNEGIGNGRIYIYKGKRQVTPSHSNAGKITRGLSLLTMAKKGDSVTVVTDPPRTLAIGMTQSEGEEYLNIAGIKQIRKGDLSDDAIIVEQTPERTMEVFESESVETFAVPRDRIYKIEITAKDPSTVRFFNRITGLHYKPIGSMKVQFTFEGAQMITFHGDEERGKGILPQELFKCVRRGDIGVTNQVRPMRGLLGIRLEDSKSYGPTGEEPYGTNMIGKFLGDLDKMLGEAEGDKPIYITEDDI